VGRRKERKQKAGGKERKLRKPFPLNFGAIILFWEHEVS